MLIVYSLSRICQYFPTISIYFKSSSAIMKIMMIVDQIIFLVLLNLQLKTSSGIDQLKTKAIDSDESDKNSYDSV